MFNKLIVWWNERRAKALRRKERNKIIKTIDEIIKSKWDSVPNEQLTSWQSDEIFEKTFNVGNLRIRYTRLIRGDLITVYIGENEVGGWVDQSHAYSNLLGMNGVELKFSYEDLQNAMNK